MPVWLDSIPEKAAQVPRPDTRRWLLFLAFIMLCGSTLTLWHWTAERSGLVFWFTALGLPFCVWGLLFSLRRFAYKAEQVAVESRNTAREKLMEREIFRGQRCAWILGYHVQHFAGNHPDELVKAIQRAVPVAEVSTPRGSESAVRYAALAAFQTDWVMELHSVTTLLVTHVQPVLDALPGNIACCVMLDCDDDIYQRALLQFQSEFSAKTGRQCRLLAGKGLAAVDSWLDRHWDQPCLLIVVTFSLPASPAEGDADAVTLVILSNRQAADYPDALCLHRPEKGRETTLTKTLQRALLWAAITPATPGAAWYTGPVLARGSDWNKACDDNGITFSLTEKNRHIDSTLGYTSRAAPWLAIILANAVFNEDGPQIIAAQAAAEVDDIWVMVINRKQT